MQINLNHLRIFYYAAKERTLTKAAEALFVTQPAVSMQIKALEQYLDVPLFRKRGKFLELTHEGSVLFKYAEKIFGAVEEMEHALKGFASLTHGSLIIGTTRSFARHLMPGSFRATRKNFPALKYPWRWAAPVKSPKALEISSMILVSSEEFRFQAT
jgi:DNA-binding transcriptional LysR family regulator